MKRLKNITSIILFFVFLFVLTTNVQAVSSMQAKLEGDTLEVKKGQEIVVNFKLDDYEDINKGINAYKATLEYNKNVFEEVVQSDFQAQNNWEELKFNKDTGELVSIKKSGSKTGEIVARITLKVKEDATVGRTDISLSNIVTSEGKEDINVGKDEESATKLTVNIIEKQTTTPEEPNKPTSPEKPTNPEKPENSMNQRIQTIQTSQLVQMIQIIQLARIIQKSQVIKTAPRTQTILIIHKTLVLQRIQ